MIFCIIHSHWDCKHNLVGCGSKCILKINLKSPELAESEIALFEGAILLRVPLLVLLMVQKSSVHQLRLVVELPLFTRCFYTSKSWCFSPDFERSIISSREFDLVKSTVSFREWGHWGLRRLPDSSEVSPV